MQVSKTFHRPYDNLEMGGYDPCSGKKGAHPVPWAMEQLGHPVPSVPELATYKLVVRFFFFKRKSLTKTIQTKNQFSQFFLKKDLKQSKS